MTVNRQQTRDENLRALNVDKHFCKCSGGSFKIFPLYKLSHKNNFLLEKKEAHFIKTLKPELSSRVHLEYLI